MAAIKTASNGGGRFLVNTHHHPDHTSGDLSMAKLGAVILSRDELRAHLASVTTRLRPPAFPVITTRARRRCQNGEDIQLIRC